MEDPLKTQVAGSHYKDMKIQPAEFCHANGIPYLEGCAIKYICRHRAKNKAEDIRKAIHFLKLLLKLEYGADEQTEPVPASKADMRVGQEVGDVKRGCPAVAPNGLHLLCTLDEGHSGPHQAFAGGKKPEQVWEDKPEIVALPKTLDDAFDVVYPKMASVAWECSTCGAMVAAHEPHMCPTKP